jgi:hypothetical protein
MSSFDAGQDAARGALRLFAGIVDFGLEQAESAVRQTRGLLRRSDLREMTGDLHTDLKARGDLVLGRFAPPAEAHMESLARRVKAARGETLDA